ncbi:MAG TPA: phage holin family protein [Candidatus Sulfomarinibacteraceae bacterium]|nr:phage holin family protein [Candidatus Sulfomarinibacteraceae bacterium]
MNASDDAGAVELIRDLRDGLTRLLRLELQLARAELEASAASMVKSAALLAAAGVVALGTWLCLLAAATVGVQALLAAAGLGPRASLGSALVVMAAVTAAAAAVLVARGRARLGSARLAPERTIESVRDVVTPGGTEGGDG